MRREGVEFGVWIITRYYAKAHTVYLILRSQERDELNQKGRNIPESIGQISDTKILET